MTVGREQRLTPEERANLAAYIDGELAEAEEQAIATKLALSATARREVESLKQTWELLDLLPRPQPSADFQDRTLTSIRTLESRALSWDRSAHEWLLHAGRVVMLALLAAGALALGYFLLAWVWPDPSLRMARDLSLAEHLDEYQRIGSFELLEQLVNSREFGSPRN